MPLLIILLVLNTAIQKADASSPVTAGAEKYQANPRYCEGAKDCAIREGACGPQVMNIHFDNAKLLALRPFIECVQTEPPSEPLVCAEHVCMSAGEHAESKAKASAPNKHYECTAEAKMCPDGSAVGRSGPNCEFAKCPGEK